MVKLSIIVPIYKVEDYLCKCVDSLLAQDISDYEIILIDDGSPDGCPAICDSYAQMNELENEGIRELGKPLIRVIHRENGGLSAARNSGIEVAKGEYIMFIDSDDYIQPNVLGALIKTIEEKQPDVLRYNYQNVRLKNEGIRELGNEREYEVFSPNKDPKRDVDYSEEVTDGETFLNERLGPGCYAWQFIIRRDLIMKELENEGVSELERDCLFKEGIYFEDTEWTPRMLVSAKRVASTPMVVYNYLWRTGSITLPTDPKKREKVIQDKISLLRGFKEQSRLVTDPTWFTWMTSSTVMSILGLISSLTAMERKHFLRELEELHVYPLSVAKEKMISHKLKTILANISPSLYCKLMSLRR